MQNYSRIANNEITAAVSRILPVPREAPQVPNSVVIGERKGGPKQNRLEVLERRQLFKLSEILSFPMEASKIFQTCILSFPLPRHRPTSIVFSRENGAGRLVSSGRPVHYHIFHKVQIFRAFPRPDRSPAIRDPETVDGTRKRDAARYTIFSTASNATGLGTMI